MLIFLIYHHWFSGMSEVGSVLKIKMIFPFDTSVLSYYRLDTFREKKNEPFL